MNVHEIEHLFGEITEDSFCGFTFGKSSQLLVIGRVTIPDTNKVKYILKCHECSKDSELLVRVYFCLKRDI